jgi:hypothetical protein
MIAARIRLHMLCLQHRLVLRAVLVIRQARWKLPHLNYWWSCWCAHGCVEGVGGSCVVVSTGSEAAVQLVESSAVNMVICFCCNTISYAVHVMTEGAGLKLECLVVMQSAVCGHGRRCC